ncbi:MAG: 50S ribosomal protein L9 [Pyrinomonadaceae bacterium]|nr:50S ribosomal protein L9 [Pyrinomonadaceae bacterium]
MATTTILLREDIENLGGRGEIVKVKAGYARNFLLPKGIATLATKSNVKLIVREREALLKKSATEKSTAEAQAEQMKGISLSFERKAGDDGTLFGSVTNIDIAEALQAKGYEIDRRRINLKNTIKETGDYSVSVKIHREVSIEIPVTVTAEGGAQKKAKVAAAEEKVVENSVETTGEEAAS